MYELLASSFPVSVSGNVGLNGPIKATIGNVNGHIGVSGGVGIKGPVTVGGHIGIYPSSVTEVVVIVVLAVVFAAIGAAIGVIVTRKDAAKQLDAALAAVESARIELENVPGRKSLKAAASELEHISGLGRSHRVFDRFLLFPRGALDSSLGFVDLLPDTTAAALLDASRSIDLFNTGALSLNDRLSGGGPVDDSLVSSLDDIAENTAAHARYAGSLINAALGSAPAAPSAEPTAPEPEPDPEPVSSPPTAASQTEPGYGEEPLQ